jgi:uncharacterized protein VirK/YbjX
MVRKIRFALPTSSKQKRLKELASSKKKIKKRYNEVSNMECKI